MSNQYKKLWSKVVLGVLMLGVFLAPVNTHLTKNTASAQAQKNIATQNEVFLLENFDIKDKSAFFTFSIQNTASDFYEKVVVKLYSAPWDYSTGFTPPAGIQGLQSIEAPSPVTLSFLPKQYHSVTFNNLAPNTSYFAVAYLINPNQVSGPGSGDWDTFMTVNLTFTTPPENSQNPGVVNSVGGSSFKTEDLDLGCGITTIFTNCLVAGLYYIVFEPLSFLTRLAATFLDFFIYYSVSSESYTSGFVEKAWSVVRDIANMFFILALLYVGIKTILGMNTSSNKRILGMIVLIALIMNFSLFVSRVVIDASNILARVFYTNITPYNANGQVQQGDNEAKSISVGLVRTFKPQNVISQPAQNIGNFAIVTIIFIIFLLYMIFMFVSVALLFVARVAGLWIVMIFSPIAFASYTVPFTIPRFGKGEWWNQLFKLSFMAPIFTFFLYIIVLFGGFLTGIQNNVASVDGGWLDTLMESIIPFVLIFIMLRKAKSLAEEYSGEIGQAITKTGNVMGGLAVGALTGGTAMLARGSVGALGSRLASSEGLRNVAAKGGVRGYLARQQMNLGKYVATSSFDLRNAKVAGVGMQEIGFQELGKAKTGGYIAMRDEQIKRRQQRAADLASSPDSAPYRALQNAELEQQALIRRQITDGNGELKSVADILAKVDKDLSDKEKEIENINNDLKNRKNDDPEKGQLEAKLKQARLERNELRSEKKAVKDSGVFVNSKGEVKDYSSITKSGKVNKKAVEEINKQMAEAEQALQRAESERTAMNNQVTAATVALDQAVDDLTNAEKEAERAKTEYFKDMSNAQAKADFDKATNAVTLAQKAVTDAQKNKDDVESKNSGTSVLEATTRLDQIAKAQQVIAEKARTQGITSEEESVNHYENTIIPTLKNKIETTDKERAWNYAESFGNKSKVGHAVSWLWQRGDYSADAERQAAYRIKMGAKID